MPLTYGNSMSQRSLPPLEEFSVERSSAPITEHPNTFYGTGRKVLVVLDYKGWEEGCFRVA